MMKDELVASLMLGAVISLIVVVVWGRRLIDLVAVGAFGG